MTKNKHNKWVATSQKHWESKYFCGNYYSGNSQMFGKRTIFKCWQISPIQRLISTNYIPYRIVWWLDLTQSHVMTYHVRMVWCYCCTFAETRRQTSAHPHSGHFLRQSPTFSFPAKKKFFSIKYIYIKINIK